MQAMQSKTSYMKGRSLPVSTAYEKDLKLQKAVLGGGPGAVNYCNP